MLPGSRLTFADDNNNCMGSLLDIASMSGQFLDQKLGSLSEDDLLIDVSVIM